ncbi:anti-sigma factor family protein [Streptomyces sp. NPDC004609]|uniref:anti-sigma factor family protein n=1 Tax=Streptomyces sp. NPDC004609 TaxID=3364704 RepID=UPI00367C47F7
MSGSGPTPAEQHLGDRLAALVDGELKHDARDRVLAHLATCPKCKAEADAQRRLKDVFARTAPPPPSEGLLARLQGLPSGPGFGSGGDDDGRGGPFDGGRVTDAVYGALSPSAGRPGDRRTETFGYVPGVHAVRRAPALPGGPGGFRIHEVGRQEAERSPWRGRRFAFAAASAVSFAAIALGGAMPLETSVQARGGSGNSSTPVRTAATTGTTGTGSGAGVAVSAAARNAEYERRRSGGTSPTRSDGGPVGRSVLGPEGSETPLSLASRPTPTPLGSSFTPPPLIRPTGSAFQISTAPGLTPSATPAPSHLIAPPQPANPLMSQR